MTIKILSWDKYNPKRDQKNYTWFRLNNDIATNPELFGLNAEQKFVWVTLLSLASQKGTDTIDITLPYLNHITGVLISKVAETISFLELANIIEITHDDFNTDVSTTGSNEETSPTNVRTYERTYDHVQFNFEELYALYPRKQGKSPGMRACKRHIRTQKDYEALKSAIVRYVEHCKNRRLEAQFILLFSTFMNQWQDWLDPETGSTTIAPVKSIRPAGQEVPDAQATSGYMAKLEVTETVSKERIRELCRGVVKRL